MLSSVLRLRAPTAGRMCFCSTSRLSSGSLTRSSATRPIAASAWAPAWPPGIWTTLLKTFFEAVLKIVTRRDLVAQGKTAGEADEIVRKSVRTQYQSVASAAVAFRDLTGRELFACLEQQERDRLAAVFEKRHPITHNLGVVDPQVP